MAKQYMSLKKYRAMRLGNLRSLFRWRYGPTLPDGAGGAGGDLDELLYPISLGPKEHRKRRMRFEIEIFAPWESPEDAGRRIARILGMPTTMRGPNARTLGQRLRLTNHERERLHLWSIKPFDMTDEDLAEQRKAKKRAKDERRRRKAGARCREAYLATFDKSLNTTKPWEAEGIDRSTHFRRKAKNATGSAPGKRSQSLREPSRTSVTCPSAQNLSQGKKTPDPRPSTKDQGTTERPTPSLDVVGANPVAPDALRTDLRRPKGKLVTISNLMPASGGGCIPVETEVYRFGCMPVVAACLPTAARPLPQRTEAHLSATAPVSPARPTHAFGLRQAARR